VRSGKFGPKISKKSGKFNPKISAGEWKYIENIGISTLHEVFMKYFRKSALNSVLILENIFSTLNLKNCW